jgi:hypothetical protein
LTPDVNDKSDEASSRKSKEQITLGSIFVRSTLLAIIISGPAMLVTIIVYYVLRMDWIPSLMSGFVTLVVAMGFGYKFSNRIANSGHKDGDI